MSSLAPSQGVSTGFRRVRSAAMYLGCLESQRIRRAARFERLGITPRQRQTAYRPGNGGVFSHITPWGYDQMWAALKPPAVCFGGVQSLETARRIT